MDQILDWLGQYSAPVALLLVVGAALIYVLQRIVERAVQAEFDNSSKRMQLLLERRLRFEEKMLLDQYELVTTLQLKLASIAADLNRMRSGSEVDGLMQGREIAPLSAVYVELQAKRFLLKASFHRLLNAEADVLLASANAKTSEEWQRLAQQYLGLNDELHAEMNQVFGIESIRWDSLGGGVR